MFDEFKNLKSIELSALNEHQKFSEVLNSGAKIPNTKIVFRNYYLDFISNFLKLKIISNLKFK